MSQFQLFPPPSPAKAAKNPFRKGPQKAAAGSPQAGNMAVVVQVTEDTDTDTASVKSPPKAHVARAVASPVTIASPLSPESRASSPQTSPQRSNSPFIPMRSIFPRYNHDRPLDQQQYYPQARPQGPRTPSPVQQRRPRDLSLSPPPEIDRTLGPKTVPASVINFPVGVLDPVEVRYSSTKELGALWDAANGQRSQGQSSGSFHLRMSRTDSATFTFGEPHSPFYTLQTLTTNELSITRSNPSQPHSKIPIMSLKLEDRRRRDPPADGLVTLLFSRLAAMLAIDQAAETAHQRRLGPAQAAELEGTALRKAAAQESCTLTWNREKKVYEVAHPALSKQPPAPALVGAGGIALSPVRSKYAVPDGVLHITVSTPSPSPSPSTDPRRKHNQPPTILLTTPLPANAVETGNMAATPRTSTLPLTDADEPLASLDLASRTLSISAAAIMATVPSLYAIDSLVAALLAVAAADETTSPFLADMALFDPEKPLPPSPPGNTSVRDEARQGALVATRAERQDAREADDLVTDVKAKDEENANARSQRKWYHFWVWGRGRGKGTPKPKKQKNQKIVVEEFDLEKYGRYGQGSAREGQKLPGLTRGALRVLFWGLGVVVRCLTVLVKVVAWALVGMTRCLTSERF